MRQKHLLNFVSIVGGAIISIMILTLGPKVFGLSTSVAPVLAMAVWIASTWVLWGRGKEPGTKGDGPGSADSSH